jgi:glycosyltransferase involved in cell wall biosynthesis
MKISIITSTLNCISTIQDCLDSIGQQTYMNKEHIVIDGGSSDGTFDLLDANRERFSFFVSEIDNGIYDALNKGIDNTSGDVVGFLHADDLFAHPDVLTHIAATFEADLSVCAVYGDLVYVRSNDTNTVVRHWKSSVFTLKRLAWGWMPPHPTLYVRREWYSVIGGLDTRYRISADYFSILQMFSNSSFHSVYLPEVLVKMRLGGASNRSIKAILRKIREDWDALKRTDIGALGGVGALFWKNFGKLSQFRWTKVDL